jgi:hypothetical protein
MTFLPYVSLFVALTVCCSTRVLAQSPVDPTGHWEGTIHAEIAVPFEVDLVRNTKGELAGTINLPAENIQGLPIARIAIEGTTLKFHVRADQPLTGTVAADGKSISGDMATSGGAAPFTMTRTGEARIDIAVVHQPVSAPLVGTWRGGIETRMGSMRLALEIANRDGGAVARLINLDQGSLEMPASAITQDGARLTLEFKSVGVSFAGALNAAGTELSGTISQRQGSLPMTFTRQTP